MPVLSSGVIGLDSLIGGGFLVPGVFLIEGAPGTGKTSLAKAFLTKGIKNNEPCIYAEGYAPPSSIDIENALVIDCFSWRVKRPTGKYTLYPVTDLNAFFQMIKSAADETNIDSKTGRMVIDSISDFVLYTDERSVFRFTQLLVGFVKQRSLCALLVMESGVHPKEVESTLEYLVDGVIHLAVEKGKRWLKIKKMPVPHSLKRFEFNIGKRGMYISV
ncbi:MAG: hypothetical protein J7K68_02490 [Candidatus Diapherotrites archaeon]|nr:hypothetical protein [Candidatus Diapherotrites archaeon]